MGKPGKKGRLWTEYPPIFMEAVDFFSQNPQATEWKRQCSKADAYSLKTQFYRFFDKVREEWRDSTPEIREHTGLNRAYHWGNNLIIGATSYGEWWFVRLRKNIATVPERPPLPPAVKERLKEISLEITQQRADKLEDDMTKILGDWRTADSTTSMEQIKEEATAAGVALCPATELPCRRKCDSICMKTGGPKEIKKEEGMQ